MSNVFMGKYQHSIDGKGRLIVPAKFREGLGDNFVVTKGLDGSLTIYPSSEWQEFVDKLNALPSTNPDARAYQRFVFSGASECEVDKQGRILLAVDLREHAKLDKDVLLVGVNRRVEIWSKDVWEAYHAAKMEVASMEELAANLGI